MERQKPENADFYAWDEFNKWADKNGIAYHLGQWEPWWNCWSSAYAEALNEV